MAIPSSRWNIRWAAILATAFVSGVLGDSLLVTSGFANCKTNSNINIQQVDFSYNNDAQLISFDMSGVSDKQYNVSITLAVTAYGHDVYSNTFNPCESATFFGQLCPIPKGVFNSTGSQSVPAQYSNAIPGIAFQMPDIVAQATLQLKPLGETKDAGCIHAQVTNKKTAHVAAVSYVAASVAGVALLMGSAGAVGSAMSGGASAAGSGAGAGGFSPSFVEVFGVFQGFAVNGLMSVQLPEVYQSFTRNFAFSTGLIPWTQMQISIDNFRAMTGGNLTNDSVEYLQKSKLLAASGSSGNSTLASRAIRDLVYLAARDTEDDDSSSPEDAIHNALTGIQRYVQQLTVPQANTFMTVLLIVAIVIGVIVVGILLVKVILEAWSLYGNFPESLSGFRKHYWNSIARAITSLILVLYSIWVLYCVFQFTHGDSWGAQTLAGVTLVIFTGILAFFSWKIWSIANRLKNAEGDVASLYEDKKIWVKYSMFYESYRKDYWWIFVPVILYMFVKGFVLAATDGHGMAQSICLLLVEGAMLALLAWAKPFERKSGNVINISIQAVRFLSVVCVFIFVEEFGIAQSTQTVAGVVLIVVQSILAASLAVLIGWNAIVALCKQNPHRKRRKEMEKMNRDFDSLTPLDARNSLLLERIKTGQSGITISFSAPASDDKKPIEQDSSASRYTGVTVESAASPYSPLGDPFQRSLTPTMSIGGANQSRESLVSGMPSARQSGTPSLGGANGSLGQKK